MKTLLLITHSSASAGGGEDEFTRLLLHLKQKYRIFIIIPEGPRKDFYIKHSDEHLIIPARVFQINPDSIKEYIKFIYVSILKLQKIFPFILKNKKKINLCYVNSSVCFVELIPVVFFKIKYILSVKETIEPDFIRKILFKFYSGTAKKIIAISEYIKDKIKTTKNPELVTKIYSSIDEKKYIELKNQYHSTDKDKAPFTVLNIGPFYKLKNQHLLISALKCLPKTENIAIKFIGKIVDENYYNYCVSLIDTDELKKKVIFLGEKVKSETIKEILDSDCLTITSTREGFSLVLLEGFILEKPVLSTPVGVIPEVVVNKENGLIFEDDNPSYLAELLLQLKNNQKFYNSIVLKGLQTYFSRFNDEACINKIEKEINKCI